MTEKLTYEQALDQLAQGKLVAREAWENLRFLFKTVDGKNQDLEKFWAETKILYHPVQYKDNLVYQMLQTDGGLYAPYIGIYSNRIATDWYVIDVDQLIRRVLWCIEYTAFKAYKAYYPNGDWFGLKAASADSEAAEYNYKKWHDVGRAMLVYSYQHVPLQTEVKP